MRVGRDDYPKRVQLAYGEQTRFVIAMVPHLTTDQLIELAGEITTALQER